MYESLALSENGFLFDTRAGHTYTLNRTGTFLLRRLIEGARSEDLATALVEAFEVDPATAARDVQHFVFRLTDLGLTPARADGEDGEARA